MRELVIITLWFLESSCGTQLVHQDRSSHGHLGIKEIVIIDINTRKYGYQKWKLADCLDKHKSFAIARDYFELYQKENWEIKDYLLLWRCGPRGMKKPNFKQREYANHGISVHKQICQGVSLKYLR